ncbi:hypothetical protein LguiA_021447 [Lonicera macranthoides]
MTTTTRSKTATISGASVIVAAILLATTITGANAQSPMAAPTYAPTYAPSYPLAPGPALDCVTALYNLTDCLSFVTAGSNLTKPDPPCCGELAGLVESTPVCLCQLLGNPGATGLDIDLKKALTLPNVCGVSTPSVTLCSAFGVPVGVPAPSEGPAGPGSATSPGSTPGADSSGVSIIAVFDMSIFIGLVIAFFTLFL